VKGTLHWVSADHALSAEVRLYDRLFTKEIPGEGEADFKAHLNSNSLQVLMGCKLEPGLASAEVGEVYQFERLGYFCLDSVDSRSDSLVFNRTVALRDSWAKIAGRVNRKG
jgi:glutaminyl-tRNA synthetase